MNESTSEPELYWLGQAGFLLRGTSTSVAFDPYLSDLCLHVHGLHRQQAAPFNASTLGADLLLVSHWHEDHLDLDSAGELMGAGARFIAPPSCIVRLASRGIDSAALIPITAGQEIEYGNAVVTAVPARHQVPGFLTEDAVGYLVEIDGTRIYHSGDTVYDRTLLAAAAHGALDVALLCINGTGGNMNVWEAAMLAAQLGAAVAVPMHFGMWEQSGYGPGATLNPEQFREIYQRILPGAAVRVPKLGAAIRVSP